MAGHSQFKNIMHRKGAQDSKRARMFAKITREIIVAAKSGLPDPNSNPRLRSALASARAANMPKDNIDRALKKVLGGDDDTNFDEVRYEGYGPGGVAIIAEALTDNRNRTASEVRSIFSKNGGNLGETGGVSFQFERIGNIVVDGSLGFDKVFEIALDAGADDVNESDDNKIEISCSVDAFGAVRDAITEKLGDPSEAKIIWKPHNLLTVDEETARTLIKLVDALDNNDDVQNVYANFDVSADILEKIMG